jgi:hypothetical protein
LEVEKSRLKKLITDLNQDNSILKESPWGKLLSSSIICKILGHILETLMVFQRRACQMLDQARTA